jgi:hypothetical protein
MGQPDVYLDVIITDAKGGNIGDGHGGVEWADTFSVYSKLADVLELVPQTGLEKRISVPPRPLFENGPINFKLGAQSWDTSSDVCSVGKYDNGNANDFFGSLIFGDSFVPVSHSIDISAELY